MCGSPAIRHTKRSRSCRERNVDAPHNPYKLVWVIFTERDGEKRQHHFIDDRRITEYVDDFHYREIDYRRRAGEAGERAGACQDIDTPSWAVGYPFESVIEQQDDGI